MSFKSNSAHQDHGREPLSGLVERVTFHSPETGFCVLRVKVKGHRELVTVVGTAASIQPGEFIQCSGKWDSHRDHGVQFKCPSSKHSGLLSLFFTGGSGSSWFDVKPLVVDGSSGVFERSVF